jgi:YfiH family protein
VLPQWPVPAGVHAFCSERDGGVSSAPYDSLNLGDHVGDDPAAVAENRRRFAGSLGARPVFLKQVHGRGVVRLEGTTPDGTEADACWTTERGVACTMMVADCLPVLLAPRAGGIVGAAHCGWRGLADGVLEALWQEMAPLAGAPGEMLAWLGPCIGPEAFEVGPEVRAAFVARDPGAADAFRAHGAGSFSRTCRPSHDGGSPRWDCVRCTAMTAAVPGARSPSLQGSFRTGGTASAGGWRRASGSPEAAAASASRRSRAARRAGRPMRYIRRATGPTP